MKKYLITGFSGFVSYYFLEYLEKNEIHASIKGLDIHPPELCHDLFKFVKIDFEEVDLLHKDRVEKIIFKFRPDYILHLASYSSVAFSWKEPVFSFQNNMNIFLNLIDSVRKLKLSTRILSIGSSEEYGNVKKIDLPLTESNIPKPASPYAVARLSQELMSKIYIDGYGLDIVMTRSFNHIGPLQKDIFVVSSFAKQIVDLKRAGKQAGELITGDTSIIRDFTDVRDIVRAYYLLLNEGKTGEIYNVCSGIGISLYEIIRMMADMLNIDISTRIKKDLIRPNDNRIIIGSNEKVKKGLGWNVSIPLEKSLFDIINYWHKY